MHRLLIVASLAFLSASVGCSGATQGEPGTVAVEAGPNALRFVGDWYDDDGNHVYTIRVKGPDLTLRMLLKNGDPAVVEDVRFQEKRLTFEYYFSHISEDTGYRVTTPRARIVLEPTDRDTLAQDASTVALSGKRSSWKSTLKKRPSVK